MGDTQYMRMALEYAKKGMGFVNPNPMVGAVLVKDGRIIGQGYHEKYGSPHAERNAIDSCLTSPEGAVLYVTLEPCCHFGNTPPCIEIIMQSGIKRVVVGTRDPNPLVAGKGMEVLRQNGVEVIAGILEKECRELNEVFFYYIQSNRPFVIMKYAMTMDGKSASCSGKSKWITSEPARERVHQDRHRYSAIMAGVGTVLADNPLLTCRIEKGKNPIRIICDTHLRTPLDSNIVESAKEVPTIIATSCKDEKRYRLYRDSACDILVLSKENGHVDLNELMSELGKRKIDSVYLEGGGTLNWSALQSGIVNKVHAYIAPKLLGGAEAISPVTGSGIDEPDHGFFLSGSKITLLGEDILIESEVVKNVYGYCGGNREGPENSK